MLARNALTCIHMRLEFINAQFHLTVHWIFIMFYARKSRSRDNVDVQRIFLLVFFWFGSCCLPFSSFSNPFTAIVNINGELWRFACQLLAEWGWVFECGCELDQLRLSPTVLQWRNICLTEAISIFITSRWMTVISYARTSHTFFSVRRQLRSHISRECEFPSTHSVLDDFVMRFSNHLLWLHVCKMLKPMNFELRWWTHARRR